MMVQLLLSHVFEKRKCVKEIVMLVMHQMLIMGICMAFGYYCYVKKVFGDQSIREFASLTMKYTIPLSISLSFKEQFQFTRSIEWGQVFALTSLGFGLIILLITLVIPSRSRHYQQKRMCALIPNNAIFGLVIAQSLFGGEGVFLMSAHIVVSNILLWTYGIGILSEKTSLKSILLNPAVVGVLAGIVLVLLPFEIPAVIYTPLENLTALNSPVGLMLAGGYIARIKLSSCFRSGAYYLIAFYKLILGPTLVVPLLLLFRVDRTIALVVLVGMLAPTGTAAATFTEMVGMDNSFSSGSVAFNELACVLTIPVMMTLYMNIFR